MLISVSVVLDLRESNIAEAPLSVNPLPSSLNCWHTLFVRRSSANIKAPSSPNPMPTNNDKTREFINHVIIYNYQKIGTVDFYISNSNAIYVKILTATIVIREITRFSIARSVVKLASWNRVIMVSN